MDLHKPIKSTIKMLNLVRFPLPRSFTAMAEMKFEIFALSTGVLESYKSKVAESQCCSPYTWLVHLFPILEWLPKYKWASDFSQDVVSGVTVAVVHIPQGMSDEVNSSVFNES